MPHSEISIMNMLGQSVAKVYSGVLDANEHNFNWSPRGVGPLRPTGVYQCVVRMNGRVQTMPIVVE